MKSRRKINVFVIAVFTVYICMLVYFLFFSDKFGRMSGEHSYSYNLKPFREILRFLKYADILGTTSAWLNLVGNIVAFLPFGIFVPVIFKPELKVWEIMFVTMVLSLIIECMQLISMVGSFDVDDIMLNTLGGLTGGIVYRIIYRYRHGGKND